MEKMTKKEQFAKVRAILAEKGENDLVAFIDHEVELLTAKNSRRSNKPTKTQRENVVLAEKILESMTAGKAVTISEIQRNCVDVRELSNQKVSAIVRSLVSDGKLNRSEVKGKAFFTKA
jgi:hypothetical protein